MKRSLGVAGATLSALCLTVTGCGSSDLGSTAPAASQSASIAAVSADPALHAKLPAKVQSSGVLQVGVAANYKPNEYLDADGKSIVGMDVDLLDAVAQRLGVRTAWTSSQFATVLNGIVAGKYDVGASSFTINAEREKSVNMVSYLNAGTQWATQTGNPKKVDATKPCGATVAVQTGTVQADELNAANKGQCASNKVKLLPFAEQSEVNTALASGRADAMAADSSITQYAIKQSNGQIATLGAMTDSAPYGIVVPKNEKDFAEAIRQALADLKASGQYDAILDKWGQKDLGLSTFQVNPPA